MLIVKGADGERRYCPRRGLFVTARDKRKREHRVEIDEKEDDYA
jgi:hypothetical protein